MEALLGAVIVGALALVGQAWQRRGDARIRREEKEQDWARQDQVAEKLLKAQAATLVRTDEVARLAAQQSSTVALQLAALHTQAVDIHTLVNSDMTAARQELLDQTRILLGLYERTISADLDAGREPRPADVQALDDAREKVTELTLVLADRLAQQRIVEANAQQPASS
jgi:hypothetical protein